MSLRGGQLGFTSVGDVPSDGQSVPSTDFATIGKGAPSYLKVLDKIVPNVSNFSGRFRFSNTFGRGLCGFEAFAMAFNIPELGSRADWLIARTVDLYSGKPGCTDFSYFRSLASLAFHNYQSMWHTLH